MVNEVSKYCGGDTETCRDTIGINSLSYVSFVVGAFRHYLFHIKRKYPTCAMLPSIRKEEKYRQNCIIIKQNAQCL